MPITLKNAAKADVVYSQYRVNGTRAIYIGAEHDDLKKDQLVVSTTDPKVTAQARGNRKGSLNLVRTVETPGVSADVTAVLKDAKVEIVTSFPSGMSDAARNEFAARIAAAMSDPELVKRFFVIGKITD